VSNDKYQGISLELLRQAAINADSSGWYNHFNIYQVAQQFGVTPNDIREMFKAWHDKQCIELRAWDGKRAAPFAEWSDEASFWNSPFDNGYVRVRIRLKGKQFLASRSSVEKIRLSRGEWFYDPTMLLGEKGGFGVVYAGHSSVYGDIAVKKLHLQAADAAHRELRIAMDLAGRDLTHVMPVLDAGEDAESSGAYFVVMPRAENTLKEALSQVKIFGTAEAVSIIAQIIDGLLEVNDLVHRDLKPGNILFHDGKWKVADFGIARFVEESTSLRTLKDCLSAQYAAPEQWEYRRATGATDIYALGCIGYVLVTGSPPFRGPSREDFRNQHLQLDPPALDASVPPRLQTLLSMMLRKAQDARPNLARVKGILTDLLQSIGANRAGKGFEMLAEAGASVAKAKAEVERIENQVQSEGDIRCDLAKSARRILRQIVERIFETIERNAPIANRAAYSVILGRGMLQLSIEENPSDIDSGALPRGVFVNSKWDVITTETVTVEQRHPDYVWSASLWYCKLPDTTEYRWYEASYYSWRADEIIAPYHLSNQICDADWAASPGMHIYQLAFGPQAIDDEDEDDFSERWVALLALAAEGKLGHPRGMPLQPKFWQHPFVA
jgi:eukaryotic-like serine/threonine-protein kinase